MKLLKPVSVRCGTLPSWGVFPIMQSRMVHAKIKNKKVPGRHSSAFSPLFRAGFETIP